MLCGEIAISHIPDVTVTYLYLPPHRTLRTPRTRLPLDLIRFGLPTRSICLPFSRFVVDFDLVCVTCRSTRRITRTLPHCVPPGFSTVYLFFASFRARTRVTFGYHLPFTATFGIYTAFCCAFSAHCTSFVTHHYYIYGFSGTHVPTLSVGWIFYTPYLPALRSLPHCPLRYGLPTPLPYGPLYLYTCY